MVSTENASPFLERLSAKGLRICVLSQIEQRVDKVVLGGERALVVRPGRVGRVTLRANRSHGS